MIRGVLVASCVCVACSGAREAPQQPAAAAPTALPPASASASPPSETPPAPLPAGTYFRAGFTSCGECPRPGAAVVAGAHDTIEAATAQLAKLEPAAPGYPLVVTAEELAAGLEPGTIAVVAGLFRDTAAAERWSRATGAGGTVVVIANAKQWRARWESVPYGQRRRVVTILPGSSVEARHSPGGPVRCEVPASSVHVVSLVELGTHYYAWAPVSCPDGTGWVPWRATRVDATVSVERGTPRLRQVIGEECSHGVIEARPWPGERDASAHR